MTVKLSTIDDLLIASCDTFQTNGRIDNCKISTMIIIFNRGQISSCDTFQTDGRIDNCKISTMIIIADIIVYISL